MPDHVPPSQAVARTRAAASRAGAAPVRPAPARTDAVLAVASAATFVSFLDVTVVNVAMPDLERSFSGASLSLLSWVIAAYGIVFAAALAPAGRLADAIGRRAVFLAGFATFTVASTLCAAAPTVGALIALRAVQGAGGAMMIPAALGMVLAATPPERRAAAVGLWGASGSLAAVAGPILGSALISVSDWRAVFAINVPLGALAIVMGVRPLPRAIRGERRVPDVPGAALLAAGFALVLVAVTETGAWGWGDGRTLGSLAAGAVALAAALRRAHSHPSPAIDVALWRSRPFAVANVASLLFGAVLYAWLLVGVLFATAVWHWSILEAGLSVTPGAVASAVAAVLAGRFVDGHGPRPAIVAGSTLLAAVGTWYGTTLGTDPAFWALWLPGGLLGGAAIGTTTVGITSAAARALPPARFAAGSGLNMTARQIGGAIGVAVLATVLETADAGPGGYRTAFLLCAGGAVLVAASVLGRVQAPRPSRERRRRATSAGRPPRSATGA